MNRTENGILPNVWHCRRLAPRRRRVGAAVARESSCKRLPCQRQVCRQAKRRPQGGAQWQCVVMWSAAVHSAERYGGSQTPSESWGLQPFRAFPDRARRDATGRPTGHSECIYLSASDPSTQQRIPPPRIHQPSQAWRFVSFEMRIVTRKQHAFQPFGIVEDLSRHPSAHGLQKIP